MVEENKSKMFDLDCIDKRISKEFDIDNEKSSQTSTAGVERTADEMFRQRLREQKIIEDYEAKGLRVPGRLRRGFFMDRIWIRLAAKGKIASVVGVLTWAVTTIVTVYWFYRLGIDLSDALINPDEMWEKGKSYLMLFLSGNFVGILWMMLPSDVIIAIQSKFGGTRLILKD